jgi:2EXR family
MPLDQFQPFRKLPVELRLMIWKQACVEPRIVKIVAYSNILFDVADFQPYSIFTTETPPPAVMHICHEARKEGFKHYTKMFKKSPLAPVHSRGMVIYINSEKDTVCLTVGHNHFPGIVEDESTLGISLAHEYTFYRETTSLIRRIALPKPVQTTRCKLALIGLTFSVLPSLREAILVVGPINIRGRRCAKFVDLTPLEITQLFGQKINEGIEQMRKDIARAFPGEEKRIPPLTFKLL